MDPMDIDNSEVVSKGLLGACASIVGMVTKLDPEA